MQFCNKRFYLFFKGFASKTVLFKYDFVRCWCTKFFYDDCFTNLTKIFCPALTNSGFNRYSRFYRFWQNWSTFRPHWELCGRSSMTCMSCFRSDAPRAMPGKYGGAWDATSRTEKMTTFAKPLRFSINRTWLSCYTTLIALHQREAKFERTIMSNAAIECCDIWRKYDTNGDAAARLSATFCCSSPTGSNARKTRLQSPPDNKTMVAFSEKCRNLFDFMFSLLGLPMYQK